MPLVTRNASTKNLFVQSTQPAVDDGAWIDSDDSVFYTIVGGTATPLSNGFEQLAHVNTNSAGATTVTSGVFTAKEYIMALITEKRNAGNDDTKIRVGTTTVDTGANYAWSSIRGTTLSTGASATSIDGIGSAGAQHSHWIFIKNPSAQNKAIHVLTSNNIDNAAITVPEVQHTEAKWVNTSGQINIIGIVAQTGDTFDANTVDIIVWGRDAE